jgi:hypothetical protein
MNVDFSSLTCWPPLADMSCNHTSLASSGVSLAALVSLKDILLPPSTCFSISRQGHAIPGVHIRVAPGCCDLLSTAQLFYATYM